MKLVKKYYFCSYELLANVKEICEIDSSINSIKWTPNFEYHVSNQTFTHQRAYNKIFTYELIKCNWARQRLFHQNPMANDDLCKNKVLVKIQFGNSVSIFRDYYKFHYAYINHLLVVGVLVVPTVTRLFFPTRPNSVQNMADFDFADRYFKLLPIPVPILLIGLLPEN